MSSWKTVMAGQGAAYQSYNPSPVPLREIGQRPAILVIDITVAFLGEKGLSLEESIKRHPLSCGPAGWAALPQAKALIEMGRNRGFPVIYTTGDENRIVQGALRHVVDPRQSAGKEVAQIADEIAPALGEHVLAKSRASAFFGTVLTTVMIREKVDSLIVIGCATSGCIRASVIDGHSLGWPVIVADDACFDRAPLSHDVNLFEMNAKYAHVVSTAEILAAFG